MKKLIPDPDFYAKNGKGDAWLAWAKKLRDYLSKQIDEIESQLAGYPSTDMPSAAEPGLLVWKLDTNKLSASFSDAWHDVPFLDQANIFTATQSVYLDDDGAAAGPDLVVERHSDSPASNDFTGRIVFRARTGDGNMHEWAVIQAISDIVGDEVNSRGILNFYLRQIGSATGLNRRLGIGPGVAIGNTAAFMGFNTLNVESDYYSSGIKIAGNRKTGWAVATGTPTRTSFDTATVTLPQLAERVKALIDDLHATAGHGLIGT